MNTSTERVVITDESGEYETWHGTGVHHSAYPEIRAEGRSPREGAERLSQKMRQAMDGVSGAWHRGGLESALIDVREFIESLP